MASKLRDNQGAIRLNELARKSWVGIFLMFLLWVVLTAGAMTMVAREFGYTAACFHGIAV
ncbi:hypothetical protein AB4Z48_30595 [Cupriavidus sp. 2TAF22]|uniref:hypothetical protein n=1 Tax=unclassified Cupriavidus TaxID=2640874 RepID=UPI003F8EFE55